MGNARAGPPPFKLGFHVTICGDPEEDISKSQYSFVAFIDTLSLTSIPRPGQVRQAAGYEEPGAT